MAGGCLIHLVRGQAVDRPAAEVFVFLKDGETEAARRTVEELELIDAFLGCLYAGAVAIPAYPPWSDRAVASTPGGGLDEGREELEL